MQVELTSIGSELNVASLVQVLCCTPRCCPRPASVLLWVSCFLLEQGICDGQRVVSMWLEELLSIFFACMTSTPGQMWSLLA